MYIDKMLIGFLIGVPIGMILICLFGYLVTLHDDKKDNAKLYYISDKFRNWIKSKLVYFINGVKRITTSENANRVNYIV